MYWCDVTGSPVVSNANTVYHDGKIIGCVSRSGNENQKNNAMQ
jgi:hypothetical protein